MLWAPLAIIQTLPRAWSSETIGHAVSELDISVQAGGTTVGTVLWSLAAATEPPSSTPGDHWWLLDGMQLGWEISVLPPVAEPSWASFQIYDDGQDPSGWLPIELGQVCRVQVNVRVDSTDYRVADCSGRIADCTAVNVPRLGGVVYQVVVSDLLATELGGDTAPIEIASAGLASFGMVQEAYDQLIEEVPIQFEYLNPAGGTLQPITAARGRTNDISQMSVLDALNLYVMHDIRFGDLVTYVSHWVQVAYGNGNSEIPDADPTYQLVEYDPSNAFLLDALMNLVWSGSEWQAIPNPDYYADGYTGLVLYADQLLFDVGEWRQIRSESINRVELTGDFERTSGGNIKTVRASFGGLVATYGVNSRSIESPLRDRDQFVGPTDYGALEVAQALRGELSQVQQGFGLTQCTIVFDKLDPLQVDAWSESLWPIDYRQAYGRPLALVDIPAEWNLSDAPLVMGRLMGVTWRIEKAKLYADLTIRQMPPSTMLGITFDDIDTLSPDVTLDNIAESVTLDVLSITIL